MDRRRGKGRIAYAGLLLGVLVGSTAYLVSASWRDLLGVAPACQDEHGLVVCISGRQPSGTGWYGAALAAVLWLAVLRWAHTSLALRVAARTVITVGTGMYVAHLIRGEQGRSLVCNIGPDGTCLQYISPFTPTEAGLGLLLGAAGALAVVPPRSGAVPEVPGQGVVGAAAGPHDRL